MPVLHPLPQLPSCHSPLAVSLHLHHCVPLELSSASHMLSVGLRPCYIPGQGHKQVCALVAELGICRQRRNNLAGGRLDGCQVVVAVGNGVRNIIKELGVEVAKV